MCMFVMFLSTTTTTTTTATTTTIITTIMVLLLLLLLLLLQPMAGVCPSSPDCLNLNPPKPYKSSMFIFAFLQKPYVHWLLQNTRTIRAEYAQHTRNIYS